MKRYLLLFTVAFFFGFSAQVVYAQVTTNRVETRVGNPPIAAGNCPTKTGVVSNGSLFTPVIDQGVLYGHCNAAYAAAYPSNCQWAGTKYAVDVIGNDLEDVYLPKVHGHVVDWTYLTGYDEVKGSEAILKFSGIDSVTKEQYYLQLHHQVPGSGRSGRSGSVGGNICGNGCGEGHVHVQIATGQNLASESNWLDAGKEITCKNYP